MRIALCPAAPTAGRAAHAAALARSAADPDAIVVVPATSEGDGGSEPPPRVLTLSECYDRAGIFVPDRLTRRLDALTAADRSVLVLDGTAGPMVTLDAHGNRSGEVPFHFLKHYFWGGERPEVVVHFVPAHLLMHAAREWGRLLYYPPVEPSRSTASDESAKRVAAMIGEIDTLRAFFHPWAKLKRRFAFWRR